MSQLTEKELQLFAALIKNGNINDHVDWDQAARDSGYKDSKNAKVMWGRLSKKFADAAAALAGAAKGENNNSGEGSATVPVTPKKKRKAVDTDSADSLLAKRGRPTKKTKGVTTKAKPEGLASEAETVVKQQGEEEAT